MNSYDYSTYDQTQTLSGPEAAGILVFYVIVLIFSAALYVIMSYFLSRIFKKAGVKQWIAYVPFYRAWKTLELGGQPGYWAVLGIIPLVNIATTVFTYIAMYHIGLKLGKQGVFVLWAIFIPIVWFAWLAFDRSKWGDAAAPVV